MQVEASNPGRTLRDQKLIASEQQPSGEQLPMDPNEIASEQDVTALDAALRRARSPSSIETALHIPTGKEVREAAAAAVSDDLAAASLASPTATAQYSHPSSPESPATVRIITAAEEQPAQAITPTSTAGAGDNPGTAPHLGSRSAPVSPQTSTLGPPRSKQYSGRWARGAASVLSALSKAASDAAAEYDVRLAHPPPSPPKASSVQLPINSRRSARAGMPGVITPLVSARPGEGGTMLVSNPLLDPEQQQEGLDAQLPAAAADITGTAADTPAAGELAGDAPSFSHRRSNRAGMPGVLTPLTTTDAQAPVPPPSYEQAIGVGQDLPAGVVPVDDIEEAAKAKAAHPDLQTRLHQVGVDATDQLVRAGEKVGALAAMAMKTVQGAVQGVLPGGPHSEQHSGAASAEQLARGEVWEGEPEVHTLAGSGAPQHGAAAGEGVMARASHTVMGVAQTVAEGTKHAAAVVAEKTTTIASTVSHQIAAAVQEFPGRVQDKYGPDAPPRHFEAHRERDSTEPLPPDVRDDVANAVKTAQATVSSLAQGAASKARDATQVLSDQYHKVASKASEAVGTAQGAASSASQRVAEQAAHAKEVGQAGVARARELGDAGVVQARQGLDQLPGKAQELAQQVKELGRSGWEDTKEAFRPAPRADAAGAAGSDSSMQRAAGAMQSAAEGVVEAGKRVGSAAGGAAEEVKDTVTDAVQAGQQAATQIEGAASTTARGPAANVSATSVAASPAEGASTEQDLLPACGAAQGEDASGAAPSAGTIAGNAASNLANAADDLKQEVQAQAAPVVESVKEAAQQTVAEVQESTDTATYHASVGAKKGLLLAGTMAAAAAGAAASAAASAGETVADAAKTAVRAVTGRGTEGATQEGEQGAAAPNQTGDAEETAGPGGVLSGVKESVGAMASKAGGSAATALHTAEVPKETSELMQAEPAYPLHDVPFRSPRSTEERAFAEPGSGAP